MWNSCLRKKCIIRSSPQNQRVHERTVYTYTHAYCDFIRNNVELIIMGRQCVGDMSSYCSVYCPVLHMNGQPDLLSPSLTLSTRQAFKTQTVLHKGEQMPSTRPITL